MNKKQLLDLGVPEDQADKIIILHGQDIEGHKTSITSLEGEKQALMSKLSAADKAIAEFEAADIPGMRKSIEDYKAEVQRVTDEGDDALYQLQFEHVLERSLASARARNATAVMALLDYEKLDLSEDGKTIVGLDEQMKSVIEANPFMFAPDEAEPRIVAGGQSHTVIGDAALAAARKGAGLTPKE